MNDKARFEKARKMSSTLVWFLPIGIFLALTSLLEGSRAWAMMICTTAWVGVAWGLGATTTWTNHLLGQATGSPAPAWKAHLMSVLTFWGPQILGIIMMAGVGNALSEAHQPSGGFNPGNMYQTFAMYFCCVGSVWSGVYRATRQATAPSS